MQPIPVHVGEDTVLVPRLKVQQIIDLAVLRHARERKDLLEDLDDAGVDKVDRVRHLREKRDESGLTSVVIRWAFSIEGAFAIVRAAMGGEFPSILESVDATRLTQIALGCLGLDLDELAGDEKPSAEGNQETSSATG